MPYIYQIKNKSSGKSYIGCTNRDDVKKRWREHKYHVNKKGGSRLLKEDFKKYGIDDFEFRVICICFEENMYDYEKEYIKKFNSIDQGYNILKGTLRRNISISEHNKSITKGLNQYYKKNNGGTKINIEKHRKSMAKSVGVKINQYNLKEELINSFESLREAARRTGVCKSTIRNRLKKGYVKGNKFIWKRV